MARILVVDDEPDIVRLVSRYAQLEGHTVDTASNGAEAVQLCKIHRYATVILDIMMPDMDGYTACREIRKSEDLPVILLSALGNEYDKLLGFELGIDDYVVKPFSPKELMARLRAVLHRRAAAQQPEETLCFGSLKIDKRGRTVFVNEILAPLTAKEYDLLVYFAENRGIALSRGQILAHVWGYDSCFEARTVDWQVKLLRSHLGECKGYIKTLRGVGYKFEDA